MIDQKLPVGMGYSMSAVSQPAFRVPDADDADIDCRIIYEVTLLQSMSNRIYFSLFWKLKSAATNRTYWTEASAGHTPTNSTIS